jgi:hypothetical protein
MTNRNYYLTFAATLFVSFMFGVPFVGWLMDWATAGTIAYTPNWYAAVWGLLYFGGIFGIAATKPNRSEGYKTVRTLTIGILTFTCFIAFGGEYEGQEGMALLMPALLALAFILAFWFLRQQDKQREEETPVK